MIRSLPAITRVSGRGPLPPRRFLPMPCGGTVWEDGSRPRRPFSDWSPPPQPDLVPPPIPLNERGLPQ